MSRDRTVGGSKAGLAPITEAADLRGLNSAVQEVGEAHRRVITNDLHGFAGSPRHLAIAAPAEPRESSSETRRGRRDFQDVPSDSVNQAG